MRIKKWIIYKHTNKLNGKSYIGITTKKPEYRWNNGKGYNTQIVFANAIKKYGWNNFSHEILEDNIFTISEANEKEKYYITKYHTWLGDPSCNGYNKTPGGDSKIGKSYSEAGKQKLSIQRKGKPKTEQHKLHISQGNKNKIRTDEAKKHYQEATKKKPVICLSTNTIYDSASQAAKELKISRTSIIACCKKQFKQAGGYVWEYYNN